MTTKQVQFHFYNYLTHQKLFQSPIIIPISYDGHNVSIENVDHLIKVIIDRLGERLIQLSSNRMFFMWDSQSLVKSCDYEFQQIEYSESSGFLIRCYHSTWESILVKETYSLGENVNVYVEERDAGCKALNYACLRQCKSSATYDKGSGEPFPTMPISAPGSEVLITEHPYWRFKPQYQFVAHEADAFYQASRAVVRLYIEDEDRRITTGTAFFLSPRILATSLFLVKPAPIRMWISTNMFSTQESTTGNHFCKFVENGHYPLEEGIDACLLTVENYVSKHYLIPQPLRQDSQFGLVSFHDYPETTDIIREFNGKIEGSSDRVYAAVDTTLKYFKSFYPNSMAISPGVIHFDSRKYYYTHNAPATNGSIGGPCIIVGEVASFCGIHSGADFASFGSKYSLNRTFSVNNLKFQSLWKKFVLPELYQLVRDERPVLSAIHRYSDIMIS